MLIINKLQVIQSLLRGTLDLLPHYTGFRKQFFDRWASHGKPVQSRTRSHIPERRPSSLGNRRKWGSWRHGVKWYQVHFFNIFATSSHIKSLNSGSSFIDVPPMLEWLTQWGGLPPLWQRYVVGSVWASQFHCPTCWNSMKWIDMKNLNNRSESTQRKRIGFHIMAEA